MNYRVKIEEQENADYLGVLLNSVIRERPFPYCVYTLHGEMKLDYHETAALEAVLVALFTYVNKRAQERADDRDYDVRDNSKDQNYRPSKYLSARAKARAEKIVSSVFGQVIYKNGKLDRGFYRADSYVIGEIMSQSKANELAKQGMNYIEILKYFYGDIEIVKMDMMPYIYQSDPPIARIPYKSPRDTEKELFISGAGCLPASLHMCKYAFHDYDEARLYSEMSELALFSLKGGHKHENGTSMSLISAWCPTQGLSYEFINNLDDVQSAMAEHNGVAILNVKSKSGGHYVAVSTITDNSWNIHDPAKAGKTKKVYTRSELDNIFKGKAAVIWRGNTMSEFIEIKKGDKGERVKKVQKALIKAGENYKTLLGYYGADGDFGGATKTAVMAYQKDNGLFDDGVVDEKTYYSLFPDEKTHEEPEPETPNDEPISNIELIEQKLDQIGLLVDDIKGLL